MEYKLIFGVIAVVLNLSSLGLYFHGIFLRSTKPHPFTWLIWGIVSSVAFFAQLSGGGGAGAWSTGVGSIACLSIAALALSFGEKHITKLDWACLAGALMGIALWLVTQEPLLAVVVVTVVDALGFIPTFRKAYHKPYEETMGTYVLAVFSFMFAIAALDSLNLTTVLFPLYIVVSATALAILLVVRRRALPLYGT